MTGPSVPGFCHGLHGDTEVLLAPRDGWLALLAQGWRLHEPVPDDLAPAHRAWSVLLWRPLSPA